MTPTILVAGATGNTGTSVVETLSSLISSSTFPDHRILATTRSSHGKVAQRLAKLPGVEVIEQSWSEITSDWLRGHEVVRIFVAAYVNPSQFAEESTFLVEALEANIEYVVRISTTACNVRPDYKAYYPRNHWAIEALLSSPEFARLKWSSLQPNVFYPYTMGEAVEFVKRVRNGREQGTLKLMLAKDVPVGVVDAGDVGSFAGRLLLEEDPSRHHKAKYVLNGPEDLTGAKLVEMIEEYIGVPVQDVIFKDMSWVDELVANTADLKGVIRSLKHAPDLTWEGQARASTTSDVVMELSPPKASAAQAFKALLESE
ncbi:NAD(P)-binding protein [Sarocladium strictum]